ncbi:Bro-N domain-containing protein [Moraxella bovis]|uniref:BRO-N domain-containing protein n=1 Tax=Moraxella bovis TaxID=476 RepID=UPI002225D77D|nr:Bro-N domain-containing protein [Moraxella bovis]UZA37091.1 Bro-N domain-containing protein [Moraxella bovis]UZA43986.1 Bro-N domain-containing protein [Moraxella bovis]
MSNLINFDFENHPVRVELKDGEPLFCLSDVAVILNLEKATPNRFNLDEGGVHKMSIIDSLNRIQEVNFISEPNLYRVIFRSNKKEAVKFQNWVFDEVLPSIRKTGSYSLPTPQTLSTVKERNGLVKTCEWFVRVASYLGYDEVWNLVHHRFNINRACELTTEQVGQATEYLQGLLLQAIAQRRGFNPQTPLPLPPIHRADVGKYDNDSVLWTRVLEPDEQIVRTKDIPQLIINEPYIDNETLTAINYASSARLASMLKNPPFLSVSDNTKEV